MKKITIFGCPFDSTCSYRVGSRFGPSVIRNVFREVEDYSPYLDMDLRDVDFIDEGDIIFKENDNHTEYALELIKKKAKQIIKSGRIPFAFGGEHLITLPVVEAVFEKNKDLKVIHLDAHCDMRDEYLGAKLSHAAVGRRMLDFIGAKSYFQFGIRSGSKEEFDFVRKQKLLNDFSEKSVESVVKKIGSAPVYLTVDLDVFDPSIFPGTGTPEPDGIFFKDFFNFLLKIRDINIVGLDIVELSPPCDPSEISSFLAARIVRELLLIINSKS